MISHDMEHTHPITVILPVYNTGKYLDRCLDSLLGQSFRDFTLLCIDDGSSDGSGSTLDARAAVDDRIRVVHLPENHGVPYARNLALDLAESEYIYFMDSDDWIDQGYLEAMLEHAGKSGLPVVIDANYLHEYENGAKSTFPGDFGFIKDGETSYIPREIHNHFPPVVWSRLYRKDWLDANDIRFPDTRLGGGDVTFTGLTTLLLDEGYVFRGPWYHYFQRPTSLMRNKEYNYWNILGFRFLYDELNARGVSMDGLRMFFAGPIMVDSEQKFDILHSFFPKIQDAVLSRRELYTPLDLFTLETICSCESYSDFRQKYSPNLAATFIRKIR